MADGPRTLAAVASGKDNNFNLLRMIAAYAVLLTHCFVLVTGSQDSEPLRLSLGMTIGSMAVDLFFATSGFLVTASLLTRASALEFIWARALRILPALLAALVVSIIVLGTFFSTMPVPDFFTDRATYVYFVKCITLVAGVGYELPGVFQGNPYGAVVNGSLWTLPHEVRMYGTLVILWIALRLFGTAARRLMLATLVVIGALAAGALLLLAHFGVLADGGNKVRLGYMFFSGAAFYVLRNRIVLAPWIALALVALLAITLNDRHWFFVAYIVSAPYLLLHLAYVPGGAIRRFNQLGDYSYGVYIYAFPVQQACIALMPGVSIAQLAVAATLLTFTLAAISWHVVEKPALKWKGAALRLTRQVLHSSDIPRERDGCKLPR
jgi:peptidoglycan/LPS O-acetylase OafA/YrhL